MSTALMQSQHSDVATSILDLSQELLEEIFACLPRQQILLSMRVCRAFYTAAQEPFHREIVLYETAKLPGLLHALIANNRKAQLVRDFTFMDFNRTFGEIGVLDALRTGAQRSTLQYILGLTRRLTELSLHGVPIESADEISAGILSLSSLTAIYVGAQYESLDYGLRAFSPKEIRAFLDMPNLTKIYISGDHGDIEQPLATAFDSEDPILGPLQHFEIRIPLAAHELQSILACIGARLKSLEISNQDGVSASGYIKAVLATVAPQLLRFGFDDCEFMEFTDDSDFSLVQYLGKLPRLQSARFCSQCLADNSLVWLSPDIRFLRFEDGAVTANGLAIAMACWSNTNEVHVDARECNFSETDKEVIEIVRRKAKGITIAYGY